MSGDQAYYYDPTTGLQFVISEPITRVPPPHPSPSTHATAQTPEPAPLGSFQNPYPASSIVLPPLPPSTTSTQYSLPPAPSYDPPQQTQTTEIPAHYFQPTTLLCRCDAFSDAQQAAPTSLQDYRHVSSSWWPAPPIPPPSAPPQRQTVMQCTHCAHGPNIYPAQPPLVPATTSSTTLSLTTPSSQAPQQPQPRPPLSTTPKPTNSSTIPTASPRPSFLGSQDQRLDYECECEYESRKWADCHVCNEKPALREEEGVLFCRGCWTEAERAEVEMGRGRGR